MFAFSGGELAWPLMLIAAAAFVFALWGKYSWLLATGIASEMVVLYALYGFHKTSHLVARVNDLVDRFGGSYASAGELDIGWIVLALGGVLVLVAATYDSIFKRN